MPPIFFIVVAIVAGIALYMLSRFVSPLLPAKLGLAFLLALAALRLRELRKEKGAELLILRKLLPPDVQMCEGGERRWRTEVILSSEEVVTDRGPRGERVYCRSGGVGNIIPPKIRFNKKRPGDKPPGVFAN